MTENEVTVLTHCLWCSLPVIPAVVIIDPSVGGYIIIIIFTNIPPTALNFESYYSCTLVPMSNSLTGSAVR